MTPKTVFITGANRGIGLGLVRELLKIPGIETLVAGARNVDGATVTCFFNKQSLFLSS